jgi:hypothetical protein
LGYPALNSILFEGEFMKTAGIVFTVILGAEITKTLLVLFLLLVVAVLVVAAAKDKTLHTAIYRDYDHISTVHHYLCFGDTCFEGVPTQDDQHHSWLETTEDGKFYMGRRRGSGGRREVDLLV